MRPTKRKRRLEKHRKSSPFAVIAFTQAELTTAEPRSSEYVVNDPKTVGLGLKITPAGRKVYIYRYRTKFGRQRKYTLGKLEDISPAQARRRARELAVEVGAGGDPSGERLDLRNAITVAEFSKRYLRDYAQPRLATSTYNEYESVISTRVLPRVGKLALVELTRADVETLHASMSTTPVRANRMLGVLKALLFKAEDWDVIPRRSNGKDLVSLPTP